MSEQIEFNATYSPEDNKLRIYASARLPDEQFLQFKEAGFKWAPKQELFYAPMWTPGRRDFCLSLVEDIQDEMTSVEERAQQRADRFKGYQANRAADAASAYQESQDLAGRVPMGQPILVGHHSERRARKVAERIDSTMAKAVKMWDTSEYWEQRVKGVLANGKYKERQDVRLRRIKKLGTDLRRQQKSIKEDQQYIVSWNRPDLSLKMGSILSGAYNGINSVYAGIHDETMTLEEAKTKAVKVHGQRIDWAQEWATHYQMRINYEEAILKAEGYEAPEPVKRKLAPIVNCAEIAGVEVHKVTKAQYKSFYSGGKYCRKSTSEYFDGHKEHEGKPPFRIRYAANSDLGMVGNNRWGSSIVFITDQKVVEVPKC